MVNYIIIETASKQLTGEQPADTGPGSRDTGDLSYDISMSLRGNLIFFPNPADAVTRGIFKASSFD
jgi:hypothetical protein